MSTKRKQASEVPVEKSASEVETKLSTSEVQAVTLPLDEYLKVAKVNPGLVASFRIEARLHPELMKPKTEDGWKAALADQAATVYE